jgi:hypothetical protein
MSAYEDAMAAGAVALGRRRSQRPKCSGCSLELGLASRIDLPGCRRWADPRWTVKP